MLTKKMLLYKVRAGKIFPYFLDVNNLELMDTLNKLLIIFKNSPNKNLTQIEEEIENNVIHSLKEEVFEGLKKLFIDRCEFLENDEEIMNKRWNMIVKMQEFISKFENFEKFEKFKTNYFNYLKESHIPILDELYEDIEMFKKIKTFNCPQNVEEIIHRYNCAQIQLLLFFTTNLILKVHFQNVLEERIFFNLLKFNKLLPKIINYSNNTIIMEVSGPLSIFKYTQMYGVRLANFLPHILKLQKWEIKAQVCIKNKTYQLILNEKIGIKSHYKNYSGYYPQEFIHFVKEFNNSTNEWFINIDNIHRIINLGDGQFCIPDFVIEHKVDNKKFYYLEFFHKWHKHDLLKRIETIKNNNIKKQLILCVESNIISQDIKDIEKILKDGIKLIKFNTLPNTKKILSMLE